VVYQKNHKPTEEAKAMRLEKFDEADAMPHSRCRHRLWHWLLGLVASVLLALYLISAIIERAVDFARSIAFSQV
jgi:hypothetical protein